MSNSTKEAVTAKETLLAVARRMNDTLPVFSTWLLGGFGAAFSIFLGHMDAAATYISRTSIRVGLGLFLISLAISVIATYLSTVVKVALIAHDDGESIGAKAAAQGTFDLKSYAAEYERGLLPPIRWLARRQMTKALRGDIAAGARLVAKLSQLQSMLVILQSLVAVIAIFAMVIGIKAQ